MTTDVYRDLLFNDGEGITHGDLNNARAFLGARLFDQVLARMCGNLAAMEDPDIGAEGGNDSALTSIAYTLNGGQCVIAQGSTNVKVKLLPGTILQRIAAADGAEPQMLAFTVRAGDVDLTVGAGHATLNRLDILQVKLELVNGDSESRDFKDAVTGALSTTTPNKTRRVQATFSIKAGTAAAKPTYPAPDAGYALVAAIYVPDTWAANFQTDATGISGSSATFSQCAIPLNVEAITVNPHEMDTTQATNWALSVGGVGVGTGYMKATGAADLLKVWCPKAGNTKRIVGISVSAEWGSSGAVLLRTVKWGVLGMAAVTDGDRDLSATLVAVGAGGGGRFVHMGHIADASPNTEPAAANSPIGDPYWAKGVGSGPAVRQLEVASGTSTSDDWPSRAYLDIDSDGGTIHEVVWYLAG